MSIAQQKSKVKMEGQNKGKGQTGANETTGTVRAAKVIQAKDSTGSAADLNITRTDRPIRWSFPSIGLGDLGARAQFGLGGSRLESGFPQFSPGRPAVLDYTSMERPLETHSTPGSTSRLAPRNLYGAVESDQERFTMEGLSVHNFRHSAISTDNSFRRGFTSPERPSHRSTSEQIRDIELEYEMYKQEKELREKEEKEQLAAAAEAECPRHEPLPLPLVAEKIESEVTIIEGTAIAELKGHGQAQSSASESSKDHSEYGNEYEEICEMLKKLTKGREAGGQAHVGGQPIEVDEFGFPTIPTDKVDDMVDEFGFKTIPTDRVDDMVDEFGFPTIPTEKEDQMVDEFGFPIAETKKNSAQPAIGKL